MAKAKTLKQDKKNKKKTEQTAVSYDKEKIIWLFDRPDKAGEYAFDTAKIAADNNLKKIFDSILEYSKLTWGEVLKHTHDANKSKHHFLTSISDTAYKRLLALHLEEEADALFSFALTNKLRIIGIRNKQFFSVLWYDPKHEVCPVGEKKHDISKL